LPHSEHISGAPGHAGFDFVGASLLAIDFVGASLLAIDVVGASLLAILCLQVTAYRLQASSYRKSIACRQAPTKNQSLAGKLLQKNQSPCVVKTVKTPV
jgi:hypothetical protein